MLLYEQILQFDLDELTKLLPLFPRVNVSLNNLLISEINFLVYSFENFLKIKFNE